MKWNKSSNIYPNLKWKMFTKTHFNLKFGNFENQALNFKDIYLPYFMKDKKSTYLTFHFVNI